MLIAGRRRGPTIVGVTADVRDPVAVQQLVQVATDRWGRLDVNVVASTLLAQAALPHLRAGRGSVVNVSSTFGHRPPPGSASTPSQPGPIDTSILTASGRPAEAIEAIEADEVRRIPLGRRGRPDWITGQVITVDGGLDLVA